jgi:dipeptidyl-peptidase-3
MNYSGNDVHHFNYVGERFADLQLLRYRLNGFEQLSLSQKILVYYLSKATLYGRDITFDQFGRYNLRIRKMLEVIYTDLTIPHDTTDFAALETYLKRVWFSNDVYHHYGSERSEECRVGEEWASMDRAFRAEYH